MLRVVRSFWRDNDMWPVRAQPPRDRGVEASWFFQVSRDNSNRGVPKKVSYVRLLVFNGIKRKKLTRHRGSRLRRGWRCEKAFWRPLRNYILTQAIAPSIQLELALDFLREGWHILRSFGRAGLRGEFQLSTSSPLSG